MLYLFVFLTHAFDVIVEVIKLELLLRAILTFTMFMAWLAVVGLAVLHPRAEVAERAQKVLGILRDYFSTLSGKGPQ